MRNSDLINWRNTTPDADSYPAHVAEALDLASDLAASSPGLFYWFRHAEDPDSFDRVRLLEFVAFFGVHTTEEEKAEWRKITDWVRKHQAPYMCKDEVDLRIKNADGHCPLCGGHVGRIGSEPKGDRGYRMSRCGHFKFDYVPDPDESVRHARSWFGGRWPYDQVSRQPLADDNGQPLVRERSSAVSAA
jgi:hypothetical protein